MSEEGVSFHANPVRNQAVDLFETCTICPKSFQTICFDGFAASNTKDFDYRHRRQHCAIANGKPDNESIECGTSFLRHPNFDDHKPVPAIFCTFYVSISAAILPMCLHDFYPRYSVLRRRAVFRNLKLFDYLLYCSFLMLYLLTHQKIGLLKAHAYRVFGRYTLFGELVLNIEQLVIVTMFIKMQNAEMQKCRIYE